MYPRIALNWLLPPLRPHERALLRAVGERLPAAAGEAFRTQVDRINYVQRRQNGREVGLYAIRGGRLFFDPALRLTDALEHELARVRFRIGARRGRASVHLVAGCVASIEYDQDPPGKDAELLIDAVDLREPAPVMPMTEARASLPAWPRRSPRHMAWPASIRFSLRPPASGASDYTILATGGIAELGVALPDDYLELLRLADGVQLGPLGICGLAEAYDLRVEGKRATS